jgi:hypothetical protein
MIRNLNSCQLMQEMAVKVATNEIEVSGQV